MTWSRRTSTGYATRGRLAGAEIVLAVGGRQFHLVTDCHQLTAFFSQPFFQFVPVFPCGCWIRLLRQHLHNVHYGKPPSLGLLVVYTADGLIFKLCGQALHERSSSRSIQGIAEASWRRGSTEFFAQLHVTSDLALDTHFV